MLLVNILLCSTVIFNILLIIFVGNFCFICSLCCLIKPFQLFVCSIFTVCTLVCSHVLINVYVHIFVYIMSIYVRICWYIMHACLCLFVQCYLCIVYTFLPLFHSYFNVAFLHDFKYLYIVIHLDKPLSSS